MVAAEIVAGPAVVVHALASGASPDFGHVESFLLAGGSGVPVPIGSTADAGVHVDRFALEVSDLKGTPPLGIELLAPPPPSFVANRDAPGIREAGEALRSFLTDVRALLPQLDEIPDDALGPFPGVRLVLPSGPPSTTVQRTVSAHLLPPTESLARKEPMLILRCDELSLVVAISLDELGRRRAPEAIRALMCGEEVAQETTVFIGQATVQGERPLHRRPGRKRTPVQVHGVRLGKCKFWWPPALRDRPIGVAVEPPTDATPGAY